MSSVPEAVKLDEAAFTELARSFRGELIRPEDPAYDERRSVWNGSIDRSPALIARCRRRRGRDRGGDVRAADGPADRGARRRSQLPGLSVCDGGHRDRPRADEGHPRGPRDAHRHGTGRRADRRARSGNAGVRARGSSRDRHPYGRRRTHARGRNRWLQRKYGLTIDRCSRSTWSRPRGARESERERKRRICSGVFAAAAATSASSPSSNSGPSRSGPSCSPGRSSGAMEDVAEVAALLPRLDLRRTRRADDDRDPRKAPSLPYRPRRAPRQAGGRRGCCYAGPVEEGERVVQPLRQLRLAGARPVRAEAVHRASGDVRSLLPAWLVVLLPSLRRRRAHRRGDRHHRGPRGADHVAADELPDLADGRGDHPSAEDETAFSGRGAGHTFNINGTTECADGFDDEREWVRNFWSALEPHHTAST